MSDIPPPAIAAAAEAIGQAMITRQSPTAIAVAALEAAMPYLIDQAEPIEIIPLQPKVLRRRS